MKRFLKSCSIRQDDGTWLAVQDWPDNKEEVMCFARNADLNRSIVECVAKMQAAKEET